MTYQVTHSTQLSVFLIAGGEGTFSVSLSVSSSLGLPGMARLSALFLMPLGLVLASPHAVTYW